MPFSAKLFVQFRPHNLIALIIVVPEEADQSIHVAGGEIPRHAKHGSSYILNAIVSHVFGRDLGFHSQVIVSWHATVRFQHSNGSMPPRPGAPTEFTEVFIEAALNIGGRADIVFFVLAFEHVNGVSLQEFQ